VRTSSESELRRAEEIAVCGSRTDMLSVVTLDGAPVGGGEPGPISRRLAAALDARVYAAAR
jgi:D-alanine transaminase